MIVEKCKKVVMEERHGRRRARRMAREMASTIGNPIGAFTGFAGNTVNSLAGEDMSGGAKVLLLLLGAGVIGGGAYYLMTKPAAAAVPPVTPGTTVTTTTVTAPAPSPAAAAACQRVQTVVNARLANMGQDASVLQPAYNYWAAQCRAAGGTPPAWPG